MVAVSVDTTDNTELRMARNCKPVNSYSWKTLVVFDSNMTTVRHENLYSRCSNSTDFDMRSLDWTRGNRNRSYNSDNQRNTIGDYTVCSDNTRMDLHLLDFLGVSPSFFSFYSPL